MSDALAIADHRKRRGSNWGTGLPPAIERARASREPKKSPPPVAATKPAPEEVPTIASLPHGALYRLVRDYAGVREAFADRAEDLGVALTEIDAAVGLTRGHTQKLLSHSNSKWSRQFGFVSLEKMLRGTGLMLAFVIDDERFAPIREQMAQRKCKRKWREQKLLPPPSQPA